MVMVMEGGAARDGVGGNKARGRGAGSEGGRDEMAAKERNNAIAVVTIFMTFISLQFVVMNSKSLADFGPIASGRHVGTPDDETGDSRCSEIHHNSSAA
jgi:hypothetical protein